MLSLFFFSLFSSISFLFLFSIFRSLFLSLFLSLSFSLFLSLSYSLSFYLYSCLAFFSFSPLSLSFSFFLSPSYSIYFSLDLFIMKIFYNRSTKSAAFCAFYVFTAPPFPSVQPKKLTLFLLQGSEPITIKGCYFIQSCNPSTH